MNLEERNTLLQALLDHEYETVIRIDLPADLAETVCTTDPLWKRTLGTAYSFNNTIRQYILEVSADADPQDIISRMELPLVEQKLSAQTPWRVHFTSRGTQAFVLYEATFFLQDPDHMIVTIRNITEAFRSVSETIQHLEQALENAEKEAEQRNSFLSLMSRSIRSPLYSIMGLTQIARQSKNGPLDREDYLHKISMSGSYMNESIEDILELRKIASEEIHLHPENIQLNRLIADVTHLISPMVQEKNMMLTVDASGVTVRNFLADRHCLRQVLQKLLQSAISYTAEGGCIQLNIRELFRTSGNVTLEFSVENRGIVVDQERLTALFRPYDHLNMQISDQIRDIDISLIILKKYLQAMDTNTLTAESEEGKGTRVSVTMTFECPETGAKENQANDTPLPDLKGRRILLVDDNHISLEIGKRLLLPRGAYVATATNGKEAVDLFCRENGRFDLIFMDILMPEMDGLEATRAIRRLINIPGSLEIPIVAMTANAFRKNFEESFQAGMNAHLVKPIEPESFYRIISDLLKL